MKMMSIFFNLQSIKLIMKYTTFFSLCKCTQAHICDLFTMRGEYKACNVQNAVLHILCD